jgi:hypothetical protein
VSPVLEDLVSLVHPSSFDKITMTVDHEAFLDLDLDAFGFVSYLSPCEADTNSPRIRIGTYKVLVTASMG